MALPIARVVPLFTLDLSALAAPVLAQDVPGKAPMNESSAIQVMRIGPSTWNCVFIEHA